MTDVQLVTIGVQAMTVAAKMSAPILLTALIIGFAISLFQSVTQIQDATLSFVPKMIAIGIALVFAGSWMMREIVTFTTNLYERIPTIVLGG
ncbi:MAG: flagellar biosynthesis protein FliQ [Micromonosporaceae bacterium]|nr:flagellar biosynthesis protein FliQ [Micromonosporaceae bacterium]